MKDKGAEIIFVGDEYNNLPGKFWRFLSLDDHDLDRILVRDTDSIIDHREAVCVKEWIESDKQFHIIRDSCSHTELILAGLFGIKAGIVRNISDRLMAFMKSADVDISHRYSDQLFLRNCIWPIIKDLALTHDNLYKFGDHVVNAPEIDSVKELNNHSINDHMGANYSYRGLKVEINAESKEKIILIFVLYDQNNNLICKYNISIPNERFVEIYLPLNYIINIEKGLWHYNFEIS